MKFKTSFVPWKDNWLLPFFNKGVTEPSPSKYPLIQSFIKVSSINGGFKIKLFRGTMPSFIKSLPNFLEFIYKLAILVPSP